MSVRAVDPRVARVPEFVGREAEMAAVRDVLAAPPVLLLVEGEAGIGKSRLVQELIRQLLAGGEAVVATCPPFRQPQTLGPVREGLTEALSGGLIAEDHVGRAAYRARAVHPGDL